MTVSRNKFKFDTETVSKASFSVTSNSKKAKTHRKSDVYQNTCGWYLTNQNSTSYLPLKKVRKYETQTSSGC